MSFLPVDALKAVWECIDKYDKTAEYFTTKFKLMDDGSGRPIRAEPSISDLPAIRVEPSELNPEWWLNQMQKVPFVMRVTIWTAHWNVLKAMQALELTNEAIWRYRKNSTGTITLIKDVTDYYPVSGNATWKRVTLNQNGGVNRQEVMGVQFGGATGHEVMETEYMLSVYCNRNPLTYANC